ncbi:MAG: type II secretion system protein GspG, partial [Planctomycetota bacterium]
LLGFQTVIEFKNQVALEEVRTIISGMIAKSELKAARTGPFQMSGMQAELQSWTGPQDEFGGAELWLMRAQNMLVLGAGRLTPEAFAARLADSRVQTAAEQFYAVLLKEFGAASGATIVQGSVHLADYASAFRSFGEATGGDSGALEFLESALPNASIRMQLIGDRFVTEAAAKYVKAKGLVAKGLGLAPLPKELLTSVPEDAIGVYATSMDGPLFWEAFKSEFEKNEEKESAEKQLTELEERYGFSVEKDIFGSVGKGMLMYLLPLKGVTSIPGMAVVVDLKDPAAMQRGLEGLMAMLGDEVGEDFKVRSKPYHDAPVWTFTFGKEDGPSNPLMNAFSPSIAIVKSRLIVTLNSTHIKKEIKRAFGEGGAAHLIATEGHGPPADATSFAYMDWAALVNGIYEGGRALGGLMGSAVPVDFAQLPQPGVFTHFFKPTVFYSRSIPDGVYYRNESSFGPEVWSGLIGVGLVAGFASRSEMHEESSDEEDEMSETEEPPEPPEPPAVDKQRLQTSGDMRHLATSIAVYQMESGKLPAKLDALLLPTKNYPEGFAGQKTLPNDGWGHGFQYSLLDAGKRYRLWSIGPDGVDQSGSGDDIVSP